MKLTIFAATGGIGRQALEQAVAAGHDVTAVVRNPGKLSGEVRIVTADLAAPDPAALSALCKELMQCCPALAREQRPDADRLAGHAGHR